MTLQAKGSLVDGADPEKRRWPQTDEDPATGTRRRGWSGRGWGDENGVSWNLRKRTL